MSHDGLHVPINQAISELIGREMLDQSRWQETLKAMESVAHGNVVSGDAVHAWLQDWDSPNELQPPKAG